MIEKSMIEQTDETALEIADSAVRARSLRDSVGRMINGYADIARELEHVEKRHYVRRARSPGNRLTADEIAKYSAYMIDVQDRDLRREYFKTVDINRTFQGLALPLIAALLEFDSTIAKFANIGVNYAYIDNLLATRHTNVAFTAVDFARNVADFNSDLARDNLNFISGYALSLLETDALRADAFMFSSAAYEIKNEEIRNYFRLFARQGRYVVLNEPIFLLPGGAVVDPMSVPLEDSRPVYSYRGLKRRQPGPLALVHNYRAMLEEAGFEILHYRAFRPEFTDLRMVNIIARVRPVVPDQAEPE